MLSKVSCQKDYRRAQRRVARDFSVSDWDRLNKDPLPGSARDKFAFLRVDRAEEALLPLYSPDRGRPAWDPAVLIRSFLLMLHLGHTSVQRWHDALAADALLRWLVGSEGVPSVGAHYDFINRVTGDDPHRDVYYPKGLFTEELKEMRKKYQLKRGEKLVNFDDGDTAELTRKYWDDASADCGRWSLPLELLFFHVAVSVSMETYPIAGGTASGDGTCLHIHASKSGHRVKDDAEAEKDADGRPLTHRYSAPDANVGWDSDVGDYFYGFAMYNVSWHSREHGIDLPLFVALRSASQHDSLTCVSAVAHMLDVAPGLRPAFFCHDSAADAARIFEWLRHRGVVPIIDWNPRQSSKDPDERRPVAVTV